MEPSIKRETPSVVEYEDFSRGAMKMEPLMLARTPNSPLSAPDFHNVHLPKLSRLGGILKKKNLF